MSATPPAMKIRRPLIILLCLLGAGTAPGQVYDWSLLPGTTVPNNGGDRAFYGPRRITTPVWR